MPVKQLQTKSYFSDSLIKPVAGGTRTFASPIVRIAQRSCKRIVKTAGN